MEPTPGRAPRVLAVVALIAGSLAAIRWAARHIREDAPGENHYPDVHPRSPERSAHGGSRTR